ncbi:MAG: molybdenum cofactor guanylyltransferase [Ktedonobacterales bacterium]|nr:molybdenum cofactor guanylyltransferase [Ktedonobacterales bacterium]
MGQDKAILRLPGNVQTLIERTIELAKTVTDAILISTNTPLRYSWLAYPQVTDLTDTQGPLAGIAAGLRGSPTSCVLVLACDLPLLQPAVVQFLIEQMLPADDAVVPRHANGGCEPLCAIYHVRALPTIMAHLQRRQFAVRRVLADIATHWVDDDDLRQIDPQLRSFRNANTPAEWQSLFADDLA